MPFIEKVMILAVLGTGALVAAVEACFFLDFVWHRNKPGSGKSMILSKPAIVAHVLAVTGVLCFCYGYFIEAYWVQVNQFTIPTTKLKDTSFRIVHISDMHCDVKKRNEQTLIDTVKQYKPDVIVFTGDEINTQKAIASFKETMAALDAQVAKLAIRGNWFQSVDSTELYDGTGFTVLERDSMQLEKNGEKINVSGLNFWSSSSRNYLLRPNSDEVYNIFLYHTPDLVEEIADFNVDLYLAGHTHGGQIALPFYGAILTFSKFGKKYEAGLYEVGQTNLYVNRGLGMEGGKAPRARFFARPEIAVFDIVPKGKAD